MHLYIINSIGKLVTDWRDKSIRSPWLAAIGIFLLASLALMPSTTYAGQAIQPVLPRNVSAQVGPIIDTTTVADLQPIHYLSGHLSDVTVVAISPDSTLIASGDADGEVRLWQSVDGQLLLKIQAHSSAITSLAWSPDGTTLASSSNDRFVKFWDKQSGEQQKTIEARLLDYVLKVEFTPDGKYLAIAGPECLAVLRDVDTGILYKTYHQRNCLPRAGGSVASWGIDFTPQGDEIMLGSGQPRCNCGSIQKWEMDVISSNELIYGYNLPVKDLDLSPDGEQIAIAMIGSSFIRLIEADSIYPLRDLAGHMFRVNSVQFSPDGQLIASASNDQRIGLWDASSGEELRMIHEHTDAVTEVEFSPDGTYLVSASRDDQVIIWGIPAD